MPRHRAGRLALVSALALSLFVPSVSADTLKVPSQHATIAAAAAAAQPGDVINVAAGTYYEVVTLAVPDVTLKGSGKCVLDARKDGEPHGAGIIVTATGVTISNITVRHAFSVSLNPGDGIYSMADGTTLDKVKVFACENFGFRGDSNGATVRGSQFSACGAGGIRMIADNVLVESTTTRRTSGTGIEVIGAAASLRKCSVFGSYDDGIEIAGDGALVESCTVTNAFGVGIAVAGNEPTVRKNKVSGGGDEEACIEIADAIGGLVEQNQCSENIGPGIYLSSCSEVTVSGNRVEHTGLAFDAALFVGGSMNVISGNTIRNAGDDGIRVAGDANSITGNKISDCSADGIDVSSGSDNVVQGNTLTANLGEGLDNAGAATDCIGNKFSKNRIDIAGAGTLDAFTGNVFTTGGADEFQQVD